ncbi:MAG: aminodeoxychorismate synthase component I [Alicyclobacillaceae bacterium]|nr:aminodeoxychorismate synthase component I [Alicyclobacillaceae bacterium]
MVWIRLDFADLGGTTVWTDPVRVLDAWDADGVFRLLAEVRAGAAEGLFAIGFIAYEAAPAFDPAFVTHPPKPGLPLAWFALFRAPAGAIITGGACTGREPGNAESRQGTGHGGSGGGSLSKVKPAADAAQFAQQVETIRAAIGRGDVYQVNLTFPVAAQVHGQMTALYERLHQAQQGAYSALIMTDRWAVLSLSPELFFSLRGQIVTTRPMKGTRPRGRSPEEDERIAAQLRASVKDRAENVMIVDLLRNDLGRVAKWGTVAVPHLFDVERYPTVHQLTSTVTACLRDGLDFADVLAALFPCGSVTGAPKVTAMRFIREMECGPRGVYCGAVGYVRPGGDACFNVAIRTLTVDFNSGRAEYGTGCGITWDSDPEEEYQEALTKARILWEAAPARPSGAEPPGPAGPPFELLETLLWEDGRYVLLERHLDRLCAAARFFGVPLRRADAQAALSALTPRLRPLPQPQRVRLLVDAAGHIRTEHAAAEPMQTRPVWAKPRPVALARTPVNARDPFLAHKTTRRTAYESRRRQFPEAFDVLLWNERGEVTEFTNGNLVWETADGQWLTPLQACGLLPGTFRAELLARGVVKEGVLTVDRLADAGRLWFINSVRGWVPVELRGSWPCQDP